MQVFMRRVLAPVLAISALSLSGTAAGALVGQPKAELKVEAERTAGGARLNFKGKNWPAGARVKITATRAPGTVKPQDFGMFDVDDKGVISLRKTAQCSTNNMEDAQNEPVTFTAVDSASGVKSTSSVEGGAWVCL